MKPHEFFDLTPGEVMAWLTPAWRGYVEQAYYREGMHRRKKLPPSIKDLFPKPREVLDGKKMHNRLKGILEQQKKMLKDDPNPKPTKRRT